MTLIDEPPKRCNARRGLAAPEHFRPVRIERRQISPGPAALILVLHAQGCAGCCGKTWMDTYPGLDAGLLIGGDDEFVLA